MYDLIDISAIIYDTDNKSKREIILTKLFNENTTVSDVVQSLTVLVPFNTRYPLGLFPHNCSNRPMIPYGTNIKISEIVASLKKRNKDINYRPLLALGCSLRAHKLKISICEGLNTKCVWLDNIDNWMLGDNISSIVSKLLSDSQFPPVYRHDVCPLDASVSFGSSTMNIDWNSNGLQLQFILNLLESYHYIGCIESLYRSDDDGVIDDSSDTIITIELSLPLAIELDQKYLYYQKYQSGSPLLYEKIGDSDEYVSIMMGGGCDLTLGQICNISSHYQIVADTVGKPLIDIYDTPAQIMEALNRWHISLRSQSKPELKSPTIAADYSSDDDDDNDDDAEIEIALLQSLPKVGRHKTEDMGAIADQISDFIADDLVLEIDTSGSEYIGEDASVRALIGSPMPVGSSPMPPLTTDILPQTVDTPVALFPVGRGPTPKAANLEVSPYTGLNLSVVDEIKSLQPSENNSPHSSHQSGGSVRNIGLRIQVQKASPPTEDSYQDAAFQTRQTTMNTTSPGSYSQTHTSSRSSKASLASFGTITPGSTFTANTPLSPNTPSYMLNLTPTQSLSLSNHSSHHSRSISNSKVAPSGTPPPARANRRLKSATEFPPIALLERKGSHFSMSSTGDLLEPRPQLPHGRSTSLTLAVPQSPLHFKQNKMGVYSHLSPLSLSMSDRSDSYDLHITDEFSEAEEERGISSPVPLSSSSRHRHFSQKKASFDTLAPPAAILPIHSLQQQHSF